MLRQVIEWLSSLRETVRFDRDLAHSEALAEIKDQIYQRLAAELGDASRFAWPVTVSCGPIALIVNGGTGCCKAVPIERKKLKLLAQLIAERQRTNKHHGN